MHPTAPECRPPSLQRGWLEVIAIVLLIEAGGVVGSLTGFLPAVPIGSITLPLVAATLFLRREGVRWLELAFPARPSAAATVAYAALALLTAVGMTMLVSFAIQPLGLPGPDLTAFVVLIEGKLSMYLWMLIPVCWGSAAIGEELLVRGFLQHRLTGMTGRGTGVALQALIFAAAHFYQGLSGVIMVFVIGLVFGLVYQRSRNLLPLFLAHGLIDTFSITAIYLGRADLLTY
ncbi:MAG: type II CAAX endopeptidase family protein [Pseudomonadota bacterium]